MEYKKTVRSVVANNKWSIPQKLNAIKLSIPSGNYKDAIPTNPLLKRHFFSTLFFENIESIKLNEPYQFTNDFKKEFKWIEFKLLNYAEDIDYFIDLKTQFETKLIQGDFNISNEILDTIEKKFGITLWGIESRLTLVQMSQGSEANWNLLSSILEKMNNLIYEFIINSSSKRVEDKISYDSFISQLQSDIDNVTDRALKDFFVFVSFTYANFEYNYDDLRGVLYVSNILSVIDQYIILQDVLIYNISKESTSDWDNLFLGFINKIERKVKSDSRLINIKNILDRNNFIEHSSNVNIIPILNSYYQGDFEICEKLSLKQLELNPNELEYYLLFVKSLIQQNKEFEAPELPSTVQHILSNIYKLLTFEKKEEDSVKELFKTALLLMKTNFGKQLYGFLAETEGLTGLHLNTATLCTSFNSAKSLLFNDIRNFQKDHFLLNAEDYYYRYHRFVFGVSDVVNQGLKGEKCHVVISKALRYYNQKKYSEVIKIFNDASELDYIPYYKERKQSLLFDAYVNTNAIKDCLLVFGKVYFDSEIIYRKLKYSSLYNLIDKCSSKHEFVSLIEYPILYSLFAKEYDLYEVYDDFICSLDTFSFSELNIDELINKFSIEKVVYFLNKVTTIDTLKYCTDYSSLNEVEEERLIILDTLLKIDSNNKLIYEKEINEIYRINSVRKVLEEVDQGRLFIDVNNLKENQIKKFNDAFERFKDIEVISLNSKSLIAFNPSNTKNWESALQESRNTTKDYNSSGYLAFKSIYLESRDNFLFSKEYGLDSCLSTRIRHGALKNHIRSVFEKLELITSKSKDQYKENLVWKNQLPGNLNSFVQQKLKLFSKEIDDYTTFIVNNLIQIQTEKTPDKRDGLFAYITNDEILYNFYVTNKERLTSIEDTIEIILSNLVNYTLLQVQNGIAQTFVKPITATYQGFIESLINALRELNLPNDCDLIPTLTVSITDIQKELEYLSDWFTLNTTSSSSLLKIETILDASIELTNRINPTFSLKPNISIKNEIAGYSNLIFVFNILLKNVIQHSKLSNDEISLSINVEYEEGRELAIISFTNNLNSKFDFNKNIEILENVKKNWNDHSNIERSNQEGESGFDKIKRILLYEALAKTEFFDYKLIENEITISLFFPYKKFDANEENIDN